MRRRPVVTARSWRAGALLTTILLLSACGSSASRSHVDPVASRPVASHSRAVTTTTAADSEKTPNPAVPAAWLADPGPASQIGRGPIPKPKLLGLVQYLENQVAASYAAGAPDQLYHYLAGTMLEGNRATINVLNGQDRRNHYAVTVNQVSVDTTDPTQVVLDMDADMTEDYFVNSTTGQVVAGGLPGPSHLDQELFLDYYPANHTWYWTGEQDLSDSDAGTDTGAGG